jgi:hypothetical protein
MVVLAVVCLYFESNCSTKKFNLKKKPVVCMGVCTVPKWCTERINHVSFRIQIENQSETKNISYACAHIETRSRTQAARNKFHERWLFKTVRHAAWTVCDDQHRLIWVEFVDDRHFRKSRSPVPIKEMLFRERSSVRLSFCFENFFENSRTFKSRA